VIRTSLVSVALILAVSSLAPSCAMCPGADAKSAERAATVYVPDPGYYAVETHEGRIYVFGDEKTHGTWQKTHDLQVRKTFIGAGPGGETLMFEVQDKVPEMARRIVERYCTETGLKLNM